jgi:hypothetical protein
MGSRPRQRPRHAGRPASEIPRQVGARSHHDQAARRRQIRLRRLRDLRRPARRRRLGGQRAVGARRGRGRAWPDALRQAFERGVPVTKLEVVGKAPNRRGTRVRFHPDEQIFGKTAHFDPARLFKMTRAKAYLFGGVEIRWRCAPSAARRRRQDRPPRRPFISPAA